MCGDVDIGTGVPIWWSMSDKPPALRNLGSVIGSLRYFGRCPCGRQHMSTHDLVLVVGDDTLCEPCARKEIAK